MSRLLTYRPRYSQTISISMRYDYRQDYKRIEFPVKVVSNGNRPLPYGRDGRQGPDAGDFIAKTMHDLMHACLPNLVPYTWTSEDWLGRRTRYTIKIYYSRLYAMFNDAPLIFDDKYNTSTIVVDEP